VAEPAASGAMAEAVAAATERRARMDRIAPR
jgi:hypothetical protein